MRFRQFQTSRQSKLPHFLLLGRPVAHSLSPLMHNTAADYYGLEERYFAVDLNPDEFNSLVPHFNSESFKGGNVTVPYKESLADYMDEVDENAQEVGAINTIVKQDRQLTGSNTDVYGFLKPLENFREKIEGTGTIIFGTGGAAKAVVHGLFQSGAEEIILISRNPAGITSFDHLKRVQVKSYDEWPAFSDEAGLIVNATPLGMEPSTRTCPVRTEEKQFLAGKICYDIVYKPLKTTFLTLAEEAGAITIGGLDMLVYQGSKSFEMWTGKPFPVKLIREKLYEHLRQ